MAISMAYPSRNWLAATLLWLAFAPFALAAIEGLDFANPQQETRYRAMINELRCLVCQNQNLADSNADLAKDLRRKTYQMIRAGKSDAQIIDFMITRYGDFVLYRPPLRPRTVLLWVGPLLFLLVALAIFISVVRARRSIAAGLTPAERAQADSLLDQDPPQ